MIIPGVQKPTLQAVVVPEGFLQRMKLSVLGQGFDGLDVVTVGLHGEHLEGFHCPAVEMNGTGPEVLVSQPMCVPVRPRWSRRK